VDQFLAHAKLPTFSTNFIPKALIAPHAGYIYSGSVAASAYRILSALPQKPTRVVLLGPSHHVALKGLAAPETPFFITPLGPIPVDRDWLDTLPAQSLILTDNLPHQSEHSLEVQLPFLQRALNEFSILPLLVGNATSDQVAEVLQSVWGNEETFIVVSSDLSHYHTYAEAQNLDRRATAMIEQLDDHLTESLACGYRAINGLLKLARHKRMSAKTLALKNSGDTSNIDNPDKHRVVGYGAYVIY
jgi:AmmeMemoRadiSam system protein B